MNAKFVIAAWQDADIDKKKMGGENACPLTVRRFFMFYQDFQLALGVLPIDLPHTQHDSHIQIAPGDHPVRPDPRANLVIMLSPGDAPPPNPH